MTSASNPLRAGTASTVVHRGGCHCGAVRFEVRAPADHEFIDCNCSLCSMSGFLHLIVPAADFTLLRGEAALAEYRFGTRRARHRFCRHCGVKSFYVPRSHPDGISVNVHCVDAGTLVANPVRPFNGRDWEGSIAALRGDSA
jgi:hypothetical protein